MSFEGTGTWKFLPVIFLLYSMHIWETKFGWSKCHCNQNLTDKGNSFFGSFRMGKLIYLAEKSVEPGTFC